MSKSNEPAFPTPYFGDGFQAIGGLTKRELFAAVAMHALLSGLDTTAKVSITAVTQDSVVFADAVLQELEENPK